MQKPILFLALIIIIPLSEILGQQYNDKRLGSWLLFYGNTKLNKNWHLSIERRYRNYELLPSNEQMLIRGGIFRNIDSTYYIGGGYAMLSENAPEDEIIRTYSSERRAWEQFSFHKKINRVRCEFRFRTEQRLMDTDVIRFRNRLAFRAIVPLNKREMGKNTWYLEVEDEIFQHFEPNIFDRHRFIAFLGYQVAPNVNLQLGYTNEFAVNYQRQYLSFSFNYSVDLSKNFKN